MTANADMIIPAATMTDFEATFAGSMDSNTVDPAATLLDSGFSAPVIPDTNMTNAIVAVSDPQISSAVVTTGTQTPPPAQASEVIPPASAIITMNAAATTTTNVQAAGPSSVITAVNSEELSTTTSNMNATASSPAAGPMPSVGVTMQTATEDSQFAASAASVVREVSPLPFDLQDFGFAAAFSNAPSSNNNAVMGVDEFNLLFDAAYGLPPVDFQPDLCVNTNNSTAAQTTPVNNSSETPAVASAGKRIVVHSDEELSKLFDDNIMRTPEDLEDIVNAIKHNSTTTKTNAGSSDEGLAMRFDDPISSQLVDSRTNASTNPSGFTTAPTLSLDSGFQSLVGSPSGSQGMQCSFSNVSTGSSINYYEPDGLNEPASSYVGTSNVQEATDGLSQVLDVQTTPPGVVNPCTRKQNSTLNSPFKSPSHSRYDSTSSSHSQETPLKEIFDVGLFGEAGISFDAALLSMTGGSSAGTKPAMPTSQPNGRVHVPAPLRKTPPANQQGGKRKRAESNIQGPAPKQARKKYPYSRDDYQPLPCLMDSMDAARYNHMRQRSYGRPQAGPLVVENNYMTAPAQHSPGQFAAQPHHQQQYHHHHERHLSAPQPRSAQQYKASHASMSTRAPPQPKPAPIQRAPRCQQAPPALTLKPSSRRPAPEPATLFSIYTDSQSRWLHRDIRAPTPPPSKINRATGFDYPIPRPTGVLMMTKDYAKIAEDRARAVAARAMAESQTQGQGQGVAQW